MNTDVWKFITVQFEEDSTGSVISTVWYMDQPLGRVVEYALRGDDHWDVFTPGQLPWVSESEIHSERSLRGAIEWLWHFRK